MEQPRKKELKIGFDAKRIVRNRTGLGNYCRTLVNGIHAEEPGLDITLYAPDRGADDLREQVALPYRYCSWAVGRSLWRARWMVKDLKRDGITLFHGLSGELPSGLRRAGIWGIVTIHDLIFLRHPEYYKPIDRWLYERKFRSTLREADLIIAISECTKRDIMELGGVSEDKIRVVYQDCGTLFKRRATEEELAEARRAYDLPPRYVLQVGTVEERKNAALAVEALRDLPTDVHLVLVGRPTKYADSLHRSSRVHLLSGVPTRLLPAIYQQAAVFVYPSRYEGFGIPIIEAIHSGLPVVAATGSCLEEAGGPDSLYVSPDDPHGLANAIGELLGSDNAERVRRSQEYVKRFEGSRMARRVIELYREG